MQSFKESTERKKLDDFSIDFMTVSDLRQVLEIERSTFPSPWSRANFLFELTQNRSAYNFVIRRRQEERKILGFSCVWILFGELKINNIAIKKEYRGKGLGRHLMSFLIDFGFRKGCDTASLEVRGSNEIAIKLYRDLGFKVIGVRKGYYSDNGEDALIMVLDMMERSRNLKDYETLKKVDEKGHSF